MFLARALLRSTQSRLLPNLRSSFARLIEVRGPSSRLNPHCLGLPQKLSQHYLISRPISLHVNLGLQSTSNTIGLRSKLVRSTPGAGPPVFLTVPPPRPPGLRQFSSSILRNARYRRFGDGGGGGGYQGESMFARMLKAAQPHHFVIIGLGLGGIYIYNTDTVEMTGRRRFNCVSRQWELNSGIQTYHEILRTERGKILPDNHPLTIMVNRVLDRLIPMAPIEGASWKVHVIHDDSMVNAFVLPGGKVFVYTGILPICGDEDGLAAVLGHEIAHVVARHPAERMSNSIITLGLVFLISALFDISGQFPSLFLNLIYGLPNSRTQEAEADNIGLMMMAKACFNPEAAVRLWARMQKAEQTAPPQFMSTHPSSYNRMEAIREWLPKAENLSEDSGCHSIRSYLPGFRQASGTSTFGW
ncbi:hypothetical protein MAP00_003348 [Monascus purpureus]|nr:hypothetical protein MAP00_003348 [Monascus purpureus]